MTEAEHMVLYSKLYGVYFFWSMPRNVYGISRKQSLMLRV